MRVVLSAVALALAVASSAMAQTEGAAPIPPSECAAAPAAPTLPDGASATRDQMNEANTAFTTWAEAYRANVLCRRTEAEALQARWRARVAEHNAAAEALNTQNAAWEAEVAEFNARSPRSSGLTRRATTN